MPTRIDACLSSNSDEYGTPKNVWGGIKVEFNPTLDPCSSDETPPLCKKFFTKEQNGLVQDWGTETVYVNCPYSNIAAWMEKCYEAAMHGATVIALVPSRTGTRWWRKWVLRATEIRYLATRLKFEGMQSSAPFDSAIVLWLPPRIDKINQAT